MTQEACRRWLENRGYRVIYQTGSYPYPGHYIADGKNWGGWHTADTLNGLYRIVKARTH